MGNGDIFNGDASVFTEVPKMMTTECSSEVGDNAVWETKSVDNVSEEQHRLLGFDSINRTSLDPFGELID